MKVLKFGGSSVGTPESLLKVKKIVENIPDNIIVVVSAFSGITDKLINSGNLASEGKLLYTEELEKIKNQHYDAIKQLIAPKDQGKIIANIRLMLNELENFLHGIYLIKELTPKTLDYILSFGERLSAYIIAKTITNGKFVDVSGVLKSNERFGNARVNLELSTPLIKKEFDELLSVSIQSGLAEIAIVPGFAATTEDNDITTLGRGGSDYTAAILAAALDATELQIWTDVDGFMTADPRKVKKAYSIEHLSYSEAMELSHFGAKVIYTPTVQPVYRKNIPIIIKNTFNPEAKGTLISNESNKAQSKTIKGIASIDNTTLITILGSGMVGVAGMSMRLFKALASCYVNIVLISQASSEHSISFAIDPKDKKKAIKAINKEFAIEINQKNIVKFKVEDELSIIAIVGENMKSTVGISALLFKELGKNGINVIAIAQGSSELNISVVIEKASERKAMNAIHEGFFLSEITTLNVFQVGVGTVGGDLVSQIANQQKELIEDYKLNINVVGIADIDKMIFNENGLELANYKELLKNSDEKSDLNVFASKIKELNLRNSIFVDCTASPKVSGMYKEMLDAFISVVAVNKIACSSKYSDYLELKTISQNRGVKYLYETNVGAGLPIIRTINDLKKSGDKIVKLEAVLSGTLNFIFNVLSEDIPMSKAIKLAQEKGYSEPDPRIDLSGIDVLRKILILSRESGYQFEKEDIKTKPFLPEECLNTKSLEEFWDVVKIADKDFEKRRKVLESKGKRWKYVAKLENDEASIQLIEVGIEHPFYYLEGSDNIISITTERYKEQPMIIKGAGAGAAVTATGIFADIISIGNL